MEARIKNLRIIHIFMLISLGMYVWMGERLRKEPRTLSDLVVLKALALLAIVIGAIVLFLRMQLLSADEEKLRLDSTDSVVLEHWYRLQIVGFALCESIGLYGFVLRFMGASLSQAAAFYAGAIILMLLSTPRRL